MPLNEKHGILQTGVGPNLSITGSTDTGIFPYGWGEVYGIYWNSGANTSFGLAKHNLSNLSPPGQGGNIYWPFGDYINQPVLFGFSGITYYDPDTQIKFLDTDGIVTPDNQILLSLKMFSAILGQAPSIENLSLGSPSGLFLTKDRFLNTGDFADINLFYTSLSGVKNPKITGYIAYASGMGMQEFDGGGNFADFTESGVLKVPIEHSEFFFQSFTPEIFRDSLPLSTIDSLPCYRITGFFSSPEERMGRASRMISFANSVSNYVVFFSGYDDNGPIYLTYIEGTEEDYCPFFPETFELSNTPYKLYALFLETGCSFDGGALELTNTPYRIAVEAAIEACFFSGGALELTNTPYQIAVATFASGCYFDGGAPELTNIY